MNALFKHLEPAHQIIIASICFVLGTFAQNTHARPVIEFPINAISVSQRAGSVAIPVETTGDFELYYSDFGTSKIKPEFKYSTQAGTTKSGTGYEGSSGTWLEFNQENSTMFISIPIYYTGATQDLFFTVVISDPYDADLGASTAVTVTIKGEKPKPTISILTTKGPLKKRFTIYGSVSNVALSDIKSVKLTINGQKMTLLGKKEWKARVRANVAGTYKMIATACLKDGTILKRRANLYIY